MFMSRSVTLANLGAKIDRDRGAQLAQTRDATWCKRPRATQWRERAFASVAATRGTVLAGLIFFFLTGPGHADLSLQAADAPWLPGINLASGEFASGTLRLHKDYTYPSSDSIDYYVSKGMRVFRIPFRAERVVQPTLTMGPRLREPDIELLTELIDHAAENDAYILLDMHDYGRMFTAGLIGRDESASDEFAAAWRLIAAHVKDRPNVIFGLMNEPNKQSAEEWLTGANAAIAAIRDEGAEQMILVPGSYWSGAHSWVKKDNHSVMLGVEDPADNFAFEVHQYLDSDSSGTSPDVVPGAGSSRLNDFTAWARQHDVRGFLGEFGWADSDAAQAEGKALLAHMSENRDVWIGWTYWAGGPWWGDYMFSVEPMEGVDRPQMSVLTQFVE